MERLSVVSLFYRLGCVGDIQELSASGTWVFRNLTDTFFGHGFFLLCLADL